MTAAIGKTANPGYRWVILGINFLACVLAYAAFTFWPMVAGDLAAMFNVDLMQVNALGAALFMAGYGVGNFIQAQMVPKTGYRIAGALGLVLMMVGMFIIPIAPSFEVALLARFLQGWGILWLIGVNSSVAWFPARQRGLASGVIGGGLTLGVGVGAFIGVAMMSIAGTWQGAFQIFGFILLASTVIWVVLFREPVKGLYPEDEAKMAAAASATGSGKTINPFLTVAAWMCAFALFFNIIQIIGFNAIVATYMIGINYTEAQAATLILIAGLTGVISTPIGGVISDGLVRKGMDPVKARAYTMALAGFLVAAVSTIIWPFIAGIHNIGLTLFWAILVGWGVPLTNSSIGALPVDVLGDEKAAGKMFGMVILVGIVGGGILAPTIATAVQGAFGWTPAFIALGIGAFVGMFIGLILPKFKLKTAA
ncbi:MAG: MFS transporter [Treponema sp.]|jgi:MFS family permease|nr:MFS transporter [Treponema sp.]